MSDIPDPRLREILLEAAVRARIAAWEKQQGLISAQLPQRKNVGYASETSIADAIYRKDIPFLEWVEDFHLRNFKKADTYQLLKRVEEDNVDAVLQAPKDKGGNHENSFFKFSGRNDRVYFLSPAHVARSLRMVMALAAAGADFNAPDSEGRLPFFYISRFNKNRHTVPVLCQVFNVSANDSGKPHAHDFSPSIFDDEEEPAHISQSLGKNLVRTEGLQQKIQQDGISSEPLDWDPPIIRAIRYRNRETLLGMNMLPPGAIDWNRRFQYNQMTPLIYAVMQADEVVESYQNWHQEASQKSDWSDLALPEHTRWDVVKALWMVRFLASRPRLDPAIKDLTGQDAEGYAYSKPVKRALEQGLEDRKALKMVMRNHPSLRFTL